MARDHDKQLLESVATRRARLREAFLHGDLGSRRTTSDNVKRFVTSFVLGAVACAGTAGFSFVQAQLAAGNGFGGMMNGGTQQQPVQQQPTQPSTPLSPTSDGPPPGEATTSPRTVPTDLPPTDGATAP